MFWGYHHLRKPPNSDGLCLLFDIHLFEWGKERSSGSPTKVSKKHRDILQVTSQDVIHSYQKLTCFGGPEIKFEIFSQLDPGGLYGLIFFQGGWSVCVFFFRSWQISFTGNTKQSDQHVMPKCNLFEIPQTITSVFRNMACRLFPDPVWKSTIVLTYLTIHKDPKG